MSQMRILLHIGMAKAGSSALQDSLAGSQAALAARGLLYPRRLGGTAYANHTLMLPAVFDWRGSRSLQFSPEARGPSLEAASRGFLDALGAEIAARAPRALILSCEHLFRVLPDRGTERLPALLAGLGGAPRVIAYLRRPSEHYLSSLQQHLKASHEVRVPRAPRYRSVIESYAAMFGEEALALQLYHRPGFVDGDIVADFAARHLAPYGVTRAELAAPARTNDTLSAESADVSRRFRLAFFRDRDNRMTQESKTLVAALRDADAATGAPRPRLRPGVAERVDYARADPLWLRDRHGVAFPGFDYRRLETGAGIPPSDAPVALEDVVEIDRSRERAILAELRAAPWAAAPERRGGIDAPARRGWIDALLAELA